MAQQAREHHEPAEIIPFPGGSARRRRWPPLPRGILLATDIALGVGLVSTLGMLVAGGDPARPSWWVGTVPLVAWISAPFLMIGLASRWLSAVGKAAWVNLLASVILPGLPALGALQLLLSSGSRLHRSYFVFAPVVMGIAYLPFLAAAIFLHRRALEH